MAAGKSHLFGKPPRAALNWFEKVGELMFVSYTDSCGKQLQVCPRGGWNSRKARFAKLDLKICSGLDDTHIRLVTQGSRPETQRTVRQF